MTSRIFASLLLLVCLFGASFALTFVNSCQELNIEDETYEMNVALLTNDSVCFNITADGITLDCKGGTINYTGAGHQDHTAILVDTAEGATILNCIATNWSGLASAVRIRSSEGAAIRNLTTSNCHYGIQADGGLASGFSLYDSHIKFSGIGAYTHFNSPDQSSLLVERCEFEGEASSDYGISARASNGIIRNSKFHGIGLSKQACLVMSLAGAGNEYQIYNNTLYDFCDTAPFPASINGGILLSGGAHNSVVWNNTIYDSGNGWALIDNFNFATDNTFHSNIIYDLGGGGVYCTGSDGHESYNNSIWDVGKTGFDSKCDDSRFYNNSVRNSSGTAFSIGGENVEVYDNVASGSLNGFAISFPTITGWISLHDNIAHSNSENGFRLEGGKSPDQVYPMQGNLAWNNSLAGFLISPGGDFPPMAGNDAWNNTIGVHFSGGEGGFFSDAEIYENQVGALFQVYSGGILSDCDIHSNTNPTFTGAGAAFVEKSSQNLIEDSRFYDNNFGVYINGSYLDEISGCDFYEVAGGEEARYGVFMTSNADSPTIEDSDFYDFDSAGAPFGVGIHYAGNTTVSPNITMRGLRIYNLGGAGINLIDFAENLDEPIPAFTLEDSYLYNTKGIALVLRGDTGQITDTYVFTPRSDILDVAGIGGAVPANPPIQANNLGIGLPDSPVNLGMGADANRSSYIVYPAIELSQVVLSNVTLGTNFASLDSSGAAKEMDTDARVHLQPNMCSGLKYYFLDGYPTTFEDIMEFGAEFTPTSKTCTGGWANFAVDHFTGYAANGTPSAPSTDGKKTEYGCTKDSDCPNSCYYCSIANDVCFLKDSSQCGLDSDCEGMVGQAITPFGHTIQLSYICENCQCVGYECTPDSLCPSGYTCEDGNCIPPDCFVDSDCASGYECVNYNCVKEATEEPEEEPSETGGIGEEPLPEEEVEQPPFPKPSEIVKEVLPFVEGTEPEEPKDGFWETVIRGVWILLLVLIVLGLFYALIYRKKKKKKE